MSTGLSTREEIVEALQVLRDSGASSIALMKCTSAYPASVSDLNLTLIPQMIDDFRIPIGYSDHTIGNTAAIAAVALGACIIEKHVKDAASTGSADESFSTLPDDLAALVAGCRDAHSARGSTTYGPTTAELPSLHFRRSVVASRNIAAGETLTRDDLVVVRPNIGAAPREFDALIGSVVDRDYVRGEGLPHPNA